MEPNTTRKKYDARGQLIQVNNEREAKDNRSMDYDADGKVLRVTYTNV